MENSLEGGATLDDVSALPPAAVSLRSKSLCVAWIDRNALTRDCFPAAARGLQPGLMISSFCSIEDFLSHSVSLVDVISYCVPDGATDPTAEILMALTAFPDRKVVIISDLSTVDRPALASKAGTGLVAFLQPQRATLQLTVSAFYLIHHNRHFSFDDTLTIAPQAFSIHDDHAEPKASLTRKERLVLQLIGQGHPNKDIAEALQMTISTVKAHVRNIMIKTQTSNRTQLALKADRRSRNDNSSAV